MARKSTKTVTVQKESWTYSKWLTAIVTIIFISILYTAVIIWIADDRIMPSEILIAATTPFATIIGFYFVKSGMENKARLAATCDTSGEEEVKV